MTVDVPFAPDQSLGLYGVPNYEEDTTISKVLGDKVTTDRVAHAKHRY